MEETDFSNNIREMSIYVNYLNIYDPRGFKSNRRKNLDIFTIIIIHLRVLAVDNSYTSIVNCFTLSLKEVL